MSIITTWLTIQDSNHGHQCLAAPTAVVKSTGLDGGGVSSSSVVTGHHGQQTTTQNCEHDDTMGHEGSKGDMRAPLEGLAFQLAVSASRTLISVVNKVNNTDTTAGGDEDHQLLILPL